MEIATEVPAQAEDDSSTTAPHPLEAVFAILGSQAELAKRLGVSAYAVTKWKQNKIPAERVLDIERAVGGRVTRHDLRPDLYPRDHAA